MERYMIMINERRMRLLQRSLIDQLIGMRLAERTHNIYLKYQYRNNLNFLLRGLEESEDISFKTYANPIRKAMGEMN